MEGAAPSKEFLPPDFDSLSRYGWSWRSTSTLDENYLDLACLLARNSTCKDGHMGCALVEGVPSGGGSNRADEQVGSITLCTINSSLFGALRSDCHAEANAVSTFAARGLSLRGLSCYVTRAPCTSCYKLLAMAGIGRIVAPQPLASPDSVASAQALQIECITLVDSKERMAWRDELGRGNEDMDRVRALREERKRMRREGTLGKKSIRKIEESKNVSSAQGATDLLPKCISDDGCSAEV